MPDKEFGLSLYSFGIERILELALFFGPQNTYYSHNSLLYKYLCSSSLSKIGFVFSNSFLHYAERSTQYEINWLCFFKFLFQVLALYAVLGTPYGERGTLNANKHVLSKVEGLALFFRHLKTQKLP